MNKQKILFASALLTAALLSGCGMNAPAATQPPVRQISMVVDEQSILDLEQNYPDLEEVNLTGSECYQAIRDYAARNPQVKVTYLVRLGSMAASPDAKSLELHPGQYDYQMLLSNLKYLSQLQKVSFPDSELTMEQVQALEEAYPNIEFDAGIFFCGIRCTAETQELNLADCDPTEAVENAQLLSQLPQLTQMELMKEDGTSAFTLEQAAALQSQVPNAMLHYSFELFGKQVSTEDEEISFANQYIGNKEGTLDTLRQALTVLRGCNRFVLDTTATLPMRSWRRCGTSSGTPPRWCGASGLARAAA